MKQAVRQTIAAGNEARDMGDWSSAVAAYEQVLTLDPANAEVRLQLGHGLKALGRFPDAEAAYRIAASLRREDPDIEVQIGHVLKLQGRVDDALDAYARALTIDPVHHQARHELISAGGRSRLPEASFGRSPKTDAFVRLSAALRLRDAATTEIAALSTYPVEAWDAFRRAYPIAPAPQAAPPGPVTVLIDAAEAQPAAVRATLTSLLDQRVTDWTAVIRAGAHLEAHPVRSLENQDRRLRFVLPDAVLPRRAVDAPTVLCEAGLMLDPEALGWLLFAGAHTGATLAYADHDHHVRDWRSGAIFADPVLLNAPDRYDLETHPHPPALLLVSSGAHDVVKRWIGEGKTGATLRRAVLLDVLGAGRRVAHLPRVLSSLSVTALNGPTSEGPPYPSRAEHAGRLDETIMVVIPTHDQPELLSRCVSSLVSKAANPGALKIQLVSHRVSDSAAAVVRSLTESGTVSAAEFDEPFNWSRMNNRQALNVAPETLLLFANDDMEMLTQDWDTRLRELLERQDIGVVGARLLYPDRTLQHAGVALGANRGRPVHEGLGHGVQAGGPGDRWRRRRQVAAVTGAFMALREAVFRQLDGFDETLAVAYSDLDLCLKARAAGLAVVYEPELELVHYESPTRGHNDTAAKVAWDDEELNAFHARWGAWMMHDPGRNPQWIGDDKRPFDGIRDLGRSTVLRHLELSAAHQPWAIRRETSPWDD
jgi:GT2 family glycosyltransferase/tetratricopeptide (TPR) repeat protein